LDLSFSRPSGAIHEWLHAIDSINPRSGEALSHLEMPSAEPMSAQLTKHVIVCLMQDLMPRSRVTIVRERWVQRRGSPIVMRRMARGLLKLTAHVPESAGSVWYHLCCGA